MSTGRHTAQSPITQNMQEIQPTQPVFISPLATMADFQYVILKKNYDHFILVDRLLRMWRLPTAGSSLHIHTPSVMGYCVAGFPLNGRHGDG